MRLSWGPLQCLVGVLQCLAVSCGCLAVSCGNYSDPVWHTTHHKFVICLILRSDSQIWCEIERVQYHAALAVASIWKGTSTNKIYEKLGWESLSDRRWLQRLVQFLKYKMVSFLDILKLLFLIPIIIFSVPEVEVTVTVSDAEQTRT